jgi:uncharacterized membrane protein
MPLRKQSKVSSEALVALCFYWLSTIVFAAAFVLVMVILFKPLKLPGHPGWPELVLLVSGVACAITALAQRLPLQNVLLATFIIAVLGGAVHALGVITGIPFGPFEFGAEFGPVVFQTLPWAVPFIWILAILNARGVARLILRPWRKINAYGFWLIGVTALLALLFDFAMEPFASRVKHYWLWTPTKFPVTWQGTPLSNFLAWAAMSVLISVVIAPALINKQPGKRNTPDFHPFAVWLGAILLFGAGCAQNGLLSAAVADGILAAAVTVFAIRGGTW